MRIVIAAFFALGFASFGLTAAPSPAEAQTVAQKCRQMHYPPGSRTSETSRQAYNDCLKRGGK